MPNSENLKVVVVSIESALATLRDGWLMEGTEAADDPTLSPDWLQIWWRHFGTPGADQVLCLVSPSGQTVGLLFTLTEVERHRRLPVRIIRCWVNSHNQRAALFLRCNPEAAARALADHWARTSSQWDLLRLQGLPEGDFASALMRHTEALHCRCISVRQWGHSRLPIGQSWEDYFRRAISNDTRKEVERQGRRLNERGAARWHNHGSVEASTIGFDDFMKVELRSWKAQGGETIGSNPILVAFYRDVIQTFAAKDEAIVTVLYLGDVPICASFNLLANRRMLSLKTSFDEQFSKYSPGSQLYKQLISHAFQAGYKEVDFYGRMPFSQRWTKDERHFVDLQILNSTLRSRLVGLAKRAGNWWAERRKNEKAPAGA